MNAIHIFDTIPHSDSRKFFAVFVLVFEMLIRVCVNRMNVSLLMRN